MTTAERRAAAAMDLRRQAQIQNQIGSINRLMRGGTYDDEMAALHQELADHRVRAERAEAAVESIRNVGAVPLDEAWSIMRAAIRRFDEERADGA